MKCKTSNVHIQTVVYVLYLMFLMASCILFVSSISMKKAKCNLDLQVSNSAMKQVH